MRTTEPATIWETLRLFRPALCRAPRSLRAALAHWTRRRGFGLALGEFETEIRAPRHSAVNRTSKAIQLSDETWQMTLDVLDLCRRRIEGMA